jgi:outer membrane protein assembly factor BamB
MAALAQNKPASEFQIGSNINKVQWMQQSGTGTLIAATNTALIGLDPKQQKVVWEIKELGSAEEDGYRNIEGTPYFLVSTRATLGLGKPQTSIVEAETGKIIFNSKEAEVKVEKATPLPALGGLLIQGIRSKKKFIGLIDLASGTEKWSIDIAEVKGGFGIGALVRKVKGALNAVFAKEPMLDINSNVLVVEGKEVTCIDGKKGTVLWKKEFEEKIEDALLTTEKDKLFVSYERRVDLLTVTDGKSAYGEKLLKIKGTCNGLSPYDKDNYVLLHSNGVNIFNAVTGELRWKKESDLDNITDIRICDKGIIAIAPDSKDEEAKIYLVNKEGKKEWTASVDGLVQILEPTEKGIVYFTSKRANLLTYEKGDEVWKKDVKLKEQPFFAFDNPNKKIIVYSDERLYAYNIASGTIDILNEKLKLKEFDEEKDVASVEVRKNGYLISSSQSMAMVDFTGKEMYNINYRQAGAGKLARLGLKALSVASSVASATNDIKSLRTTGTSTTPDGTTVITMEQDENSAAYKKARTFEDGGSGLWSAANARYLATQKTKEHNYILTKLDGVNGLVKVEKESGKQVQQFPFGDKEPNYIVDEAENKLYVVVNDKFLQVYDLK